MFKVPTDPGLTIIKEYIDNLSLATLPDPLGRYKSDYLSEETKSSILLARPTICDATNRIISPIHYLATFSSALPVAVKVNIRLYVLPFLGRGNLNAKTATSYIKMGVLMPIRRFATKLSLPWWSTFVSSMLNPVYPLRITLNLLPLRQINVPFRSFCWQHTLYFTFSKIGLNYCQGVCQCVIISTPYLYGNV